MFFLCCFVQFAQFYSPAIEVGETRPVEIDTSSTGKPDAPCRVSVTNPKGQTAELPTKPTPSGYETLFAPLEQGPHLVKVDFANQPVPDSPFSVDVMPAPDVSAVTVAGLETRKFGAAWNRCIMGCIFQQNCMSWLNTLVVEKYGNEIELSLFVCFDLDNWT